MAKRIDPSKMGKKGGEARAQALTAEQRSEIARQGAAARWGERDDVVKAICGSEDHPLVLGGVKIPCYVLEDERRVITLTGLQEGLGLNLGGGPGRLADYIGRIDPNSSNANELAVRLNDPIRFQPPHGGKIALGYEGQILADICEAILEARQQGRLKGRRYADVARYAEVLVRGFARVGIVALIDEATGYQAVRRRLALAEILDQYLDDHLNQWTKTFPDEFYYYLFKLKGWDYEVLKPGDIKPAEVGKFTRDEVYARLHPGIVAELERYNPYVVPGRRMHKHHQWLTREIGHPALERHIAVIIATMKLSKTWMGFMKNLQEVLPKASDTNYFEFIDDE